MVLWKFPGTVPSPNITGSCGCLTWLNKLHNFLHSSGHVVTFHASRLYRDLGVAKIPDVWHDIWSSSWIWDFGTPCLCSRSTTHHGECCFATSGTSSLCSDHPCAQTILIYFVDTMDGYPRTMDSVILVLNFNQLNAIQYDPRFNTSSVGSVQVHSTSRHGMDVVYSWVQWLGVISIAMAWMWCIAGCHQHSHGSRYSEHESGWPGVQCSS